ncbi:MAG: hypothetical protein RR957_00220 [Oscillospiraceae bacterium]
MNISEIIIFAREKGYDRVEYLKDWNGYKCYEPIMEHEDVVFIGLPLVILVKDNYIRMSTPDEAMKI